MLSRMQDSAINCSHLHDSFLALFLDECDLLGVIFLQLHSHEFFIYLRILH